MKLSCLIIDQFVYIYGRSICLTMRFLLLLGLAMVLSTSFVLSQTHTVSADVNNHCTYSNPCDFKVCGDHICAPGEFEQMSAQISQAQRGSTQPSNMTSGNMTINQSTGTVIAGVVSYIDRASDGTIVLIRAAHPISGQPLSFGIGFFTPDRSAISNQNYAITVTQDNTVLFSNSKAHSDSGIDTMATSPLVSSNPISVEVTLNGVGPAAADSSTWTGIKGEVLDFLQGPAETPTAAPVETTTAESTAVPEFGPVASIVLAIAILSVVVFATKTRTIPRL